MRHTTFITRMFSLAIFIAFLVSFAATPPAVLAATIPAPSVSVSAAQAQVFPDQTAQVTVTQILGDYSAVKANIVYDTQITLESQGNLGGLVVRATDPVTGAVLGPITMLPGQKQFWTSAFGGALSRHAIKKDSGKTRTFLLTFAPSSALAGVDIGIQAKMYVAENKVFNNGGNWAAESEVANTSVRVIDPPVMSSPDFSGPYTQNIEREFYVQFYNPQEDLSFSGLEIDVKIGKYNEVAPVVSELQYLDENMNWTSVVLSSDTTGTLSGTIGPLAGFNLPGKTTVTVPLRITFSISNEDMLFPASLELREKSSGLVIDRINSILAVNTQAATLTSEDLGGIQNPYKAGVARDFHVSVTNPDNGKDYSTLSLNFSLIGSLVTDVSSFQYFDPATSTWINVPTAGSQWSYTYPVNTSGFALMHNNSVTVKFRLAFARPGTYTVKLALTDGAEEVISQTFSAIVDPTMPSMSLSSFPDTFTSNVVSDPFTLTVTNPPSGQTYTNVRVDFTINGATPLSLADVLSVECRVNNTWQKAQTTLSAGTVTGSLPAASNLTLNVDSSLPYYCRIGMRTEGSYTFTFQLASGNAPSTVFPAVSAVSDVIPADIPPTGGGMFLFLPSIRN